MSKISMEIAGQEVSFLWTVGALMELEELGYKHSELLDGLSGEMPTKMRLCLAAAQINAAGGLAKGKNATPEWLKSHMPYGKLAELARCTVAAYMVGIRRENMEDDAEGDTDEVLAELQKKRTEAEQAES